MNQYKRLAANTMIFAIGSFGSKILTLFLTKLYTANINPADISTKELLEQTANYVFHHRCDSTIWTDPKL